MKRAKLFFSFVAVFWIIFVSAAVQAKDLDFIASVTLTPRRIAVLRSQQDLLKGLQNILGFPIDAELFVEALSEFYSHVLPGRTELDRSKTGKIEREFGVDSEDGLQFRLNFKDSFGNVAGFAVFYLEKNDWGAPSLHLEEVYLDPSKVKGEKIAKHLLSVSIHLLQKLTDEENATVNLRATTRGAYFGGYVWAPYGLETSPAALVDLKKKFKHWVGRRGFSPECDGEIKEVFDRIEMLTSVAEIASFESGLEAGRFGTKIGKEFLGDASEGGVSWDGFFLVNQPKSPGTKRFESLI